MKHLDIAEREALTFRVREFKGDRHHPRILMYHRTTTLGDPWRSKDETPWCSSGANYCMVKAYGVGTGTDSALARSWVRWGRKIDIEDWQIGDVMVIKRRRRGSDARTGSRGGYHVAFPYRVTGRQILLLGANQRDAFGFGLFSRRKYDIVAIRRRI